MLDDYRAPCRPDAAAGGCRQCGGKPSGRSILYCSAAHRDEFERNHFWGTARAFVVRQAERAAGCRPGILCARCREVVPRKYDVLRIFDAAWNEHHGEGHHRDPVYRAARSVVLSVASHTAEVNHIVPVNGDRQHFSCANHLDNLEALCHVCHLAVTAEQRAAGLIGARS